MHTYNIVLIITFTAAIFSGVFCGILLVLKFVKNISRPILRRVLVPLLGFYVLSVGYFTSVFFSIFYAINFNWAGALSFQSLILIPVVFYHLVFNVSKISREEKFNMWHYALPLFFGIGYIVHYNYFSFISEDYIFHKYYKSLRVLFNHWTLYFVSFIFIFKYIRLWGKREDSYSKSTAIYTNGNSNGLVFEFYRLYFVVILLFQSLIFFQFISTGEPIQYGQLILNMMMFLLHVTLCYNVFAHKFIFIHFFLNKGSYDSIELIELRGKECFLNQEVFEEYIEREKPFLNSQLVIMDMIGPLQTNRSYLSAFINNTYGMNFRMYMNKRRLLEFYMLLESGDFKEIQEKELVVMAGFKSMESFKRTKVFVDNLVIVQSKS